MTNAAVFAALTFLALFVAWVTIRWAEAGQDIDTVLEDLDRERDDG